jgi:hypothetical protein
VVMWYAYGRFSAGIFMSIATISALFREALGSGRNDCLHPEKHHLHPYVSIRVSTNLLSVVGVLSGNCGNY